MEEEGIYYFFKHSDGTHQMVVTDVSTQHPSVSGQSNVVYEEVSGGARNDMRITVWEKSQELRSGKYISNRGKSGSAAQPKGPESR